MGAGRKNYESLGCRVRAYPKHKEQLCKQTCTHANKNPHYAFFIDQGDIIYVPVKSASGLLHG